ncbi:MAG: crosslink repair DNA glycosylase YcaQ family protein [Anaerolineaceae bacterium]
MNLTLTSLNEYRKKMYRMKSGQRLPNPQQAVEFVNQRGFIFLWPIKGVELPSLWNAVAGDRPVADDHDDPGHISWSWKDQLLDKRVWYYARILKRRNTFISLELTPYFYALTPNFGSPEEDFYDQYQQGQLTLETKLVFEALLKEGPLDTLSLRKASHLVGKNSNSAFAKALDQLQMDMRVLPVSISEAGRWHYAFVYELTHRYFPDLGERARPIGESQARQLLTQKYFESVGAATANQVASLFHWTVEIAERTLGKLVQSNLLQPNISIEGQTGVFYVQKALAT